MSLKKRSDLSQGFREKNLARYIQAFEAFSEDAMHFLGVSRPSEIFLKKVLRTFLKLRAF